MMGSSSRMYPNSGRTCWATESFSSSAGVGLWYPLDLLFFARQPLKREALIVNAISRMPLLVQPADVP
jgi:hypothetical protein